MSDDTTLRIERLIDAPPEAVFRAWTTREAMEIWYQDGDDYVVNVTELDLRPGGRYRVEFGPAGEAPYIEHGVYIEIVPPMRVVLSGSLELSGGGGWSDTTVTVEFLEEEGKTRFVLVHENFPSSHERDLAGGGWPGFVDRIEHLVTGTTA